MKVIPTKPDFERIFEAHNSKERFKIKIKNDGTSAILALLYFSFAKELAAETDKLLFMDNKLDMKSSHVLAASRKVLSKYSYGDLIRNKVNAVDPSKSVTKVTDETDSEYSKDEE